MEKDYKTNESILLMLEGKLTLDDLSNRIIVSKNKIINQAQFQCSNISESEKD